MANAITFNVGADNSNFVNTMKRTQAFGNRTAGNIQKRLGGMGVATGAALGVGAVAAAAGVARMAGSIGGGIKRAYDLGGALSDLSSQTGILPGQLRVLQQAFENNGMAAADMQPAIARMQKLIVAAAKGSKPAAEAFSQIGLNFQELLKLSPDQQFLEIGRAINGLADPAAKSAGAMAIFGKSGGKLLTLFSDSNAISNAIREIGSSADILNSKAGVFDTISDKFAKMVPAKLEGFFVGVADQLATPILDILTKIEGFDFAPIGQKIGNALTAAATEFWNFFSSPGAYLTAFSMAVLSQIAGFGNELAATFTSAGSVLVNTFKILVSNGIPELVAQLGDGFKYVAIGFVRVLVMGVMDVLAGLREIPGIGEKAMESFDFLDDQNTNLAKLQSGYKDAASTLPDAFEKAMAITPRVVKDIFGQDAAAEAAQSALARGVEGGRNSFSGLAATLPSSPPAAPAVATPPEAAKNQSRFQKLQSGTSSFERLQSSARGSTSLLGANQFKLKSFGGSLGESTGLIRRGDAARRRAEAKASEKEKDKTPDSERLDKILGVMEEAWG